MPRLANILKRKHCKLVVHFKINWKFSSRQIGNAIQFFREKMNKIDLIENKICLFQKTNLLNLAWFCIISSNAKKNKKSEILLFKGIFHFHRVVPSYQCPFQFGSISAKVKNQYFLSLTKKVWCFCKASATVHHCRV